MKGRVLSWVFLAFALFALVVADQDRAWKHLQGEFRELERIEIYAHLEAARRQEAPVTSDLLSQVEDARDLLEARQDEVKSLENDLEKARHSRRWADDAYRRQQRAAAAGRAGAAELEEARQRLEERQSRAADLEHRLEDLRSEVTALEADLSRETIRTTALEERLAEIERGVLWRLPIFRAIDPTLEVIESRLPGIHRDGPTGRVPRVDRCLTCHQRAGRRQGNGDSWQIPFAGHPGDLVGAGGPHTVERFGCTVCHGGEGRSTDFARAGHLPESAEQEAEWVERWSYSRAALPETPILPAALVESGCVHCHQGEISRPSDPRAGTVSLALGRQLVRRMGCVSCHESAGQEFDLAARPGPPLDRIAAKTTPEWAYHWIAAPRRFRPTTWMPRLFDPDDPRAVATVRAMVAYLWKDAPPERDVEGAVSSRTTGNAEDGRRLFAAVGCAGCHLLDAEAVRGEVAQELLHGPNLARTGDKLRRDWLVSWLLDPRSHRADTPMPDLRLDAGEAADLAAFLMTDRDPEWGGLEIPVADPGVRDELVLEFLRDETTLEASRRRLEDMSDPEKDLYLGRQSLAAYGCYSCHGGADVARPGEPLDRLARSPRRLIEGDSEALLAHVPRPGQRAAPDYGLSRGEADAVVVTLLSLAPSAADPEHRAELGERARALVAGRRLLTRFNCLGCHELEGRGGAITAALADQRLRAPELTSTGARFQSPWLFAYLHDPGREVRRPWLGLRMPTYRLTPEEANVFVRFFAAHDDQPLFTAPPPPTSRTDVEVGKAIAIMLQCQECHPSDPEAKKRRPDELSPAYEGARRRLRPEWVIDWILEPANSIPATTMPMSFAHDGSGGFDSSFLQATLAAPMFNTQRRRLLPLFESEQELLDYLADAEQVAVALRAYLWSLGD